MAAEKFRQRLYGFVHDTRNDNRLALLIRNGLIVLIILNILAIIIETFTLSALWQKIFYYFEVFSIFVFTVEIVVKVYTADLLHTDLKPWKARFKYCLHPMAIVDFLSVAYFYLPRFIDLRILRVFRLSRVIRVFKLMHHFPEYKILNQIFREQKKQLMTSFVIASFIMIVASVLMYEMENAAQPEVFDNIFSAFWWSVATLTTVGYGDIYPITSLGKILSSIIAISSLGVIAIPGGIIAANFMKHMSEEERLCAKCKKKI